jgi:hypothetical protein
MFRDIVVSELCLVFTFTVFSAYLFVVSIFAHYCDVYECLQTEVGVVTGFIGPFQLVNRSNYSATAIYHNLPFTIAHI